MTEESPAAEGHRITTSDDLEVAAYLEISQVKAGEAEPASHPVAAPTKPETMVVFDFGSQYSMLIARRVRECGVYCELLPYDVPWEDVQRLRPKGFILSGGPASVYDEGAPRAPSYVFDSGLPVLGICYGMQLLAHQLGGKVAPGRQREYGHAVIQQENTLPAPIFKSLPDEMAVWMSHGDKVETLPPGFRSLAHSANSPVAAMSDIKGRIGLQFHPEVVHTPHGRDILRNFLYEVCSCAGDWTAENFIRESVENIRRQVGGGRVLCALSGGVDSAVTAALVHKAVGDQLLCILVDNGLMRREEPERVADVFRRHMRINLTHVEAGKRFLDRLKDITDPEQKRRRVGEEFIRVFEDEAAKLGRVDFIAQGTTYPDVIESAVGQNAAAKIKTHHNVGGLPKDMVFKLIEPLRNLFKDEVRRVGLELGLPEEMIYRQPFPGPGLAIRIMGEVTQEKLEMLRAADWVVMDEVKGSGLYRQLWQSFAVLTDTKSVGVMGDFRTYGYVAVVRAVTAEDAMTADWARLPYDVLGRISSRIVNEVPGINRVVYDITSKPPGTIEWE